ncbi:unnamed protein product [Closterium sp. Naga37s-1]|nr:unnamed protein product [Closterium sp. Naga37s-1]
MCPCAARIPYILRQAPIIPLHLQHICAQRRGAIEPVSLLLSCPLHLLPSRPLAFSTSCPLDLLPSRPLALSTSCPLDLLPSRPLALSTSCHLPLPSCLCYDAISFCHTIHPGPTRRPPSHLRALFNSSGPTSLFSPFLPHVPSCCSNAVQLVREHVAPVEEEVVSDEESDLDPPPFSDDDAYHGIDRGMQ